MSFVKIYGSILDSSVWNEEMPTRIVWITMLAMANQDGFVRGNVMGLARRANVPEDLTIRALEVLMTPDPEDASDVDDGRRLRATKGGWWITNYTKYRELRTERQVANATRQQRFRASKIVTSNARNATSRPEAEAEAEAEADLKPSPKPSRQPKLTKVSDEADASVREVFGHWAAVLWRRFHGQPPRFTPGRAAKIRQRLADGYTVDELKSAIDAVTKSPHHMGQNDQGKPWIEIELIFRKPEKVDDWLTRKIAPVRKPGATPVQPSYGTYRPKIIGYEHPGETT